MGTAENSLLNPHALRFVGNDLRRDDDVRDHVKRLKYKKLEPPPEPSENIAPEVRLVWQEVRQTLDEELQCLPERLRSPLLLCYLSGLTRDESGRATRLVACRKLFSEPGKLEHFLPLAELLFRELIADARD